MADQLVEGFAHWAKSQSDIVAVLNQGSRARTDHPADEWADVDLIIFTTNTEKYLRHSEWLQNFGKPIITHLEATAVGDELERRAIFEGGVDVDFSIISSKRLHENVARPNIQDMDMIRRGVRVLLDKTGTIESKISKLSRATTAIRTPPTSEEFDQVVNDFVYHVYWTAKKLRRGELWTAKASCDSYMKRRLVTMIEWNTSAKQGWNIDIWFNGRYLEEWADEAILKELMGTFAHYEYGDVKRALFATVDLFLRLARDTAERLGYDHSMAKVGPVIQLATSCFD